MSVQKCQCRSVSAEVSVQKCECSAEVRDENRWGGIRGERPGEGCLLYSHLYIYLHLYALKAASAPSSPQHTASWSSSAFSSCSTIPCGESHARLLSRRAFVEYAKAGGGEGEV